MISFWMFNNLKCFAVREGIWIWCKGQAIPPTQVKISSYSLCQKKHIFNSNFVSGHPGSGPKVTSSTLMLPSWFIAILQGPAKYSDLHVYYFCNCECGIKSKALKLKPLFNCKMNIYPMMTAFHQCAVSQNLLKLFSCIFLPKLIWKLSKIDRTELEFSHLSSLILISRLHSNESGSLGSFIAHTSM